MAGTRTEIVEVIAPSEADAGDLVTVEAKVKNLTTADLEVLVGGFLEGYGFSTEIWFSPEYISIPKGEIRSFTYEFTMPNEDVIIVAWGYYWSGTDWTREEPSASVAVLLTGAKTSITITAPDSAAEGAEVSVTITIENIYSYPLTIEMMADYQLGNTLYSLIGPEYVTIAPGAANARSWETSFIMLGGGVTIHAYSAYFSYAGSFHSDAEDSKDVALYVPDGVGLPLKAGGNFVVYSGQALSAADAFASIAAYLLPGSVVYYWNNITWLYEQVITTTMMVPYGIYWIEVTQDCTWTYGVDATAPSSVQLRGSEYYDGSYHGVNIVAYAGPTQSLADAFASISPYLVNLYTFDNVSKTWVSLPDPLPSNTVVVVVVNQDCTWLFVAPEILPCEISIDAPVSAQEGDVRHVFATIKNVSPYHYTYKTEIYAGADLILSTGDTITSGSSKTYGASFTMPGADVTILVWVERWSFDEWVYDNSASKDISLELVPEYAGMITKMELEYDEARGDIPVSNVPQGERGLVHIWGRNDMDEAQRMGISWIVKDPDGLTVEEYSAWEAWPYTGAGKEHEFIGGRFNLDKVGDYTINVGLYMNPDDPQGVDSYIGDLCTVAAVVPEPEFREFALSEYNKV